MALESQGRGKDPAQGAMAAVFLGLVAFERWRKKDQNGWEGGFSTNDSIKQQL